MGSWTRRIQLLDNSSSTLSSVPYFVGAAETISLSIMTSTTSASNVTIRGSNAAGFSTAIPDFSWSVLTVLPAQGQYLITPGIRWILAERANFAVSQSSNVSVTVATFHRT